MPPGTMSSILFAKHVSFEHSVSSPRPVITSRREEKNNKAKVFQRPIDNHSQSASSCLISPHFAASAVGVGRGAASFLATESTGTVLYTYTQTDDTHCWPCVENLIKPLKRESVNVKERDSARSWGCIREGREDFFRINCREGVNREVELVERGVIRRNAVTTFLRSRNPAP